MTRPSADLSRESLSYRVEKLEERQTAAPRATSPESPEGPSAPVPQAEPPSLELEQLRDAWQRSVIPAVEARSIPTASVLREAHPTGLEEDRLTVEFPRSAAFHRQLAEEPKNATLLREALYEVTGRKLAVDFAVGEDGGDDDADEEPATEEDFVSLLKDTFDAHEVEGEP